MGRRPVPPLAVLLSRLGTESPEGTDKNRPLLFLHVGLIRQALDIGHKTDIIDTLEKIIRNY